jgi:hypothetical protein
MPHGILLVKISGKTVNTTWKFRIESKTFSSLLYIGFSSIVPSAYTIKMIIRLNSDNKKSHKYAIGN